MSELALITGATGFLGGRLARALRARGVAVRALARPARDPAGDVARARLAALGVELVAGELADRAALGRALRGATRVFHMAGRLMAAGVPERAYLAAHVEGTAALLRACAAAPGLRAIVHCSTTGVLGPTGPYPADEDRPPRPGNSYERSKLAGERLALAIAAEHGLPLTVARPALVYGPGDLHLLGWFRAIDRGHYRVVGSGASLLHPIYIDDLVEGLLGCAGRGAPGRAYNLAGPAPLPIRALAAQIAAALGRRLPRGRLPLGPALAAAALLERLPLPAGLLPLTRSRVLFMSESRAYCGCRARAELGFAPRVGLAEGLRRTVAWYRAEGLL